MDRERAVKLLELYPQIDGQIESYKKILEELEQVYNPVRAIQYDGMPHGKNNISRSTEEIAMNIPDSVRQDIRHCSGRIAELQRLKVEILKEASRLPLREKNVIFSFYLYGMKWEQVAKRMHYSERQCKNIRNNAVDSLAARFENNVYISKYKA